MRLLVELNHVVLSFNHLLPVLFRVLYSLMSHPFVDTGRSNYLLKVLDVLLVGLRLDLGRVVIRTHLVS